MREKVIVPIKKYAFHIVLLILFTLPIILLVIFDYFNIESFPPSPFEASFNQKFVFEETWKGRMFYLFFIWLILTESVIDREKIAGKQPKNRLRLLALFIFALFPTIYVLSVNLLGGGYSIVTLGRNLGIYLGFEYFHWPLSLEYIVFTISFLIAIISAYGKAGLKTFSISISLLGVIAAFYMFDTIYPFGIFNPLQLFALPTAASTAAFAELLGYKASLSFPYLYKVGAQYSRLPLLSITSGGKSASALVGWPCAGVHSLLLYLLIILLFFKRSDLSNFRKSIYFLVGLGGTYFVNILRICSYLIIELNYGKDAAQTFHESYGELYFLSWIMVYILVIVCIQRFMLVEKTRYAISKIGSHLHL
jgi:thaumarchaeosortase